MSAVGARPVTVSGHSSTTPPGTRPLTLPEESKVQEAFVASMKTDLNPIISDLERLRIGKECLLKAREHALKAQEHALKAQAHRENSERLEKEAAEHGKKAAEHGNRAAEHGKKAEEHGRTGLIKTFYKIFHKADPALDKYDEIFNRYLADGSLIVIDPPNGRSFPKMVKMSSSVQYIKDNPTVTVCDFRPLEDQVSDIETLANFLKENRTVKGVAFRNTIPAIAQSQLLAAAAARPPTAPLKVQFSAKPL